MNRENRKLSRRRILAGIAAGTGGLGVAAMSAPVRGLISESASTAGDWWSRGHVALATSGATDWSGFVGSPFTIGGSAVFTLVEVRPFAQHGARPRGIARDQAFLAVFESAGAERPQGNQTYKVDHATGRFDIFFAAADPSARRPRLEAVFG